MKILSMNNANQPSYKGYVGKSLVNEISTVARRDIQDYVIRSTENGKTVDVLYMKKIQNKYYEIIAQLNKIMDKFHSETSLEVRKKDGKHLVLSNPVVNSDIEFSRHSRSIIARPIVKTKNEHSVITVEDPFSDIRETGINLDKFENFTADFKNLESKDADEEFLNLKIRQIISKANESFSRISKFFVNLKIKRAGYYAEQIGKPEETQKLKETVEKIYEDRKRPCSINKVEKDLAEENWKKAEIFLNSI